MNVRFGIIGLGYIAHRFAKVLNTVEGVELAAVASTDPERAKNFAEEFGAERFYADYESIVKDPMVDVIYIAQTHDLHYEIIKLCLNNSKGVICEKPMVLTEKQAVEVTKLAGTKKVLLMEAMWSRFIPTFKKAKEWLADGRIGTVKLVQASFCFDFPYDPAHRLYNPKLAGGSLYDAGVYPIEFTTGILGENPVEVKAVATHCESGVDDFVAMSLKFESGVVASLSCGLRASTKQNAFIYGDEGYVIVYDFLGSKKAELYNNENHLIEVFVADFEDGFIYQIQHFAQLYKNGQLESPVVPHKDNIATSAIFEAIKKQIK